MARFFGSYELIFVFPTLFLCIYFCFSKEKKEKREKGKKKKSRSCE